MYQLGVQFHRICLYYPPPPHIKVQKLLPATCHLLKRNREIFYAALVRLGMAGLSIVYNIGILSPF